MLLHCGIGAGETLAMAEQRRVKVSASSTEAVLQMPHDRCRTTAIRRGSAACGASALCPARPAPGPDPVSRAA
ncbi:hypothetical protein GCM10027162_55280 [Streptomyces incanus]